MFSSICLGWGGFGLDSGQVVWELRMQFGYSALALYLYCMVYNSPRIIKVKEFLLELQFLVESYQDYESSVWNLAK